MKILKIMTHILILLAVGENRNNPEILSPFAGLCRSAAYLTLKFS